MDVARYPDDVKPIPDPLGWNTASAPLSPDQVAQASAVGTRLIQELRPLYTKLPAHAQSGLGVARHLGVDRGTATRFAGVMARPGDALESLVHLPGVRGLRQILAAMGRLGMSKSALHAAGVAVEKLERLIHELGGSQTKLIERIEATRRRDSIGSPEEHERALLERRKSLFQSASEALGARMDLWTVCQVYRPTPGSETQMDQAMVRGTFGYRARRDAPPYALRSYGRNDGPGSAGPGGPGDESYEALEREQLESGIGVSVFREFSTDPAPIVTNRGRGKEAVVLIDAERSGEEKGVDLVVGHVLRGNWRVPWLDQPATHDVSVYVGTPAARMIFDIMLHRTMAGRCVPTMQLYRTTPAIFSNPSAHWYDLLPYSPELRLYRPAEAGLASRFHRRHAELLGVFFEKLGWPIEEFVGYRVEVEWPWWCGFYSVMFDYGGAV